MNTDALKPLIIDPGSASGKKQLETLKDSPTTKVIDTFVSQLKELCVVRDPKTKKDLPQQEKFVQKYLQNKPVDLAGNWVYYPWNQQLIHVLPEAEFFEVRTGRNQPLITKDQQNKFSSLCVAIVGLSVGHSVAMALAYSGGCNTIKLADPDTLELSNLNRVQANLSHLGKNKTHVTAQQIYELNPYANLILYDEGLKTENLKDFLTGSPAPDVIIDECDDITLKFYLRFAARSLQKPLLMVTDNGYESNVDLIRFDEDKTAGNMKDLPDFDLDEIIHALTISESLELTPEQEIQLIAELLGKENISSHMQEGVIQRLERKVASWPQIAMTVFTGGALAAYTLSRLAIAKSIHTRKTTFSFPGLLEPDYHAPESVELRKKQTKDFINFIDSLT